MSITITLRGRAARDENRQRAFISVSGVNAETYDFEMANIPIELDTDEVVLAHLETRKDFLHLFCLKKTWVGADISPFQIDGKTELEAFLDWIDDGHRNITGYDEEEEPIYEVITNHPYHGTHPPQFHWIEMIEKANSVPDLKEVLIDIFKDQI